MEVALLNLLWSKTCSLGSASDSHGLQFNVESTDDFLLSAKAERAYDFVPTDRNYIGRMVTFLHVDDEKRIRLARFQAPCPLLSLSGKGKKYTVTTYWVKAWAGPTTDPSPLPEANELITFETTKSSLRDFGWFNFDGIMLLDLSKMESSEDGLKTKGLFRDEAPRPYVRCQFVSGSAVSTSFSYTVIVLDDWALKIPEKCQLSDIPHCYFTSALFVGDRLLQLGTDDGCVVTSIFRKTPSSSSAEETPDWRFDVCWDDIAKQPQEFPLLQLDDIFVLVSVLVWSNSLKVPA
jgi:hypothetical protein